MAKKILKILFGLALVPFCLGFTWQLGASLVTIRYRPDAPYYFLAGGLAYLAVHVLFKKPILAYVVGHEFTHAFFAVLFGGAVKSIHAGERGGRVSITKSNFIITLAPYFFPLYTCIVLVLYWIAGTAGARNGISDAFVVLAGATFAFHVTLTLVFLQADQNDIREQGAVFSYPLIYLFNLAFAALLVDILVAENMDYPRFLAGGILKSVTMLYRLLYKTYALLQVG